MRRALALVVAACGHPAPAPAPSNVVHVPVDAAVDAGAHVLPIIGVEVHGASIFVVVRGGRDDGIRDGATAHLVRLGRDLGPLELVRLDESQSVWKTDHLLEPTGASVRVE
jgi:hypothetical protein